MLEDLIPLIGGGIFGAVIKLWSLSQQDKAEERKYNIMAHAKNVEVFQNNNKVALRDKGFAWTRRFIVLCVMSIIVGAFWLGEAINVPVQVTEGAKYLFGLIDTTSVNTVYQKLSGYVVLPEVLMMAKALVGTYFGQSIASR